jgi:hypothetical protein
MELPFFKKLIDNLDLNILAVGYRGYGNSEGAPTEKGIKIDAEVDTILYFRHIYLIFWMVLTILLTQTK